MYSGHIVIHGITLQYTSAWVQGDRIPTWNDNSEYITPVRASSYSIIKYTLPLLLYACSSNAVITGDII